MDIEVEAVVFELAMWIETDVYLQHSVNAEEVITSVRNKSEKPLWRRYF